MSKAERIPIAGPWITHKEIEYVSSAAATGWYENANSFNERFEKAFADYTGRSFAISLPSCTSAIHLSLLALGVKEEDEVIVPDLTWIGSSAAITYVGALPVFADVDPNSWCLSVDAVEAKITPRTKAVIAVDLYGSMPDYLALEALLTSRNIRLIEDAAEAIGSAQGNVGAGSFGDIAVFSFHGSKTLTTGEGGMLVTDDVQVYERCLFLRDHGRSKEKIFWNDEVAFKYKMSGLQAALGLAQLERIDELVSRKREIFHWYEERLRDLPYVRMNHEPPGTKNSYWMSSIVWDEGCNLSKEHFMRQLDEEGITTRPFFYPLSTLPAYRDLPLRMPLNVNALSLAPRGLNLPSALSLSSDDVDRVAARVREILLSAR